MYWSYPVVYKAYLVKPGPPAVAPMRDLGASGNSVSSPAPYGTLTVPAPYNPPQIWQLNTLKAAQISLSTTNVGNASISFYDPGLYIRQTVQPHAMNMMAFLTTNRFGTMGQCWLGYIDETHYIMDPQQGETQEFVMSSTYKLLEIARQTPADVVTLAQSYLQNVSGSTVLKYAAQASGFPPSALSIDGTADVGSGILTDIPIGDFTDPAQQTWSAVLQAMLANSGLECFTREDGTLVWRPLGYLGPQVLNATVASQSTYVPPRPVLPDEILRADLVESDKEVVTQIEVRWGYVPTTQSAARWQAPASMVTHLQSRILTVHAPWLQSKSAADYLAQALGQMYAANVLAGTVIIPADPTFQVGTLVSIPTLRTDQNSSGVYYLSAVTYQLEWGGQWVMILGLSYGRAANQSFPYLGTINTPVLTLADQAGFPNPNTILLGYSASNPAKVTNPFTVVANPSLANNVIQIDANTGIAAGSVVLLQRGDGATIGPTPNGEYTVQAAPTGSGFTVYVKSLANADPSGQGFLVVRSGAPVAADTTQGQSSSSAVSVTTFSGTQGTGFPTITLSTGTQTPQAPVAGSVALQALAQAQQLAGRPYASGMCGPVSWDCSGLVAWVYTNLGATGIKIGNGDVGPQGLYAYFLKHGAIAISVDQAQPGDMLFIQEPGAVKGYPDQQQGFSHVAFCLSAGGLASGWNFGADSQATGITSLPNAGFKSYWGTQFNLALGMAALKLS